jgi:hypothetical protein
MACLLFDFKGHTTSTQNSILKFGNIFAVPDSPECLGWIVSIATQPQSNVYQKKQVLQTNQKSQFRQQNRSFAAKNRSFNWTSYVVWHQHVSC